MTIQTPQLTQILITPEIQEKAKPLVGKVALAEVTMLSGTFQRGVIMDMNPIPPIAIQGQIQTNINVSEDGLNAQTIILLTAIGKPIEDKLENKPGFQIDASYRLRYIVQNTQLDVPTRVQAIQAMLTICATSNVWSFWREFALQASQKMNIPPVMLPLLFTINPTATQAQTANTVPANKAKRGTSQKTPVDPQEK
jgi:hypothetical protein